MGRPEGTSVIGAPAATGAIIVITFIGNGLGGAMSQPDGEHRRRCPAETSRYPQ